DTSERNGEDRWRPQDHVEAEDAGENDHARDEQERDELGCVAAAPAEPIEHRRRGEGGERNQDGLPTNKQDVRQGRRDPSAVYSAGRTAEDHRRGGPSLAGKGN